MIKHLASLINLQTLICANNNFGYMQLNSLNCCNIKKLSIGPQEKSQERVFWDMIAQKFPKLTHLKITNYQNILTENI